MHRAEQTKDEINGNPLIKGFYLNMQLSELKHLFPTISNQMEQKRCFITMKSNSQVYVTYSVLSCVTLCLYYTETYLVNKITFIYIEMIDNC